MLCLITCSALLHISSLTTLFKYFLTLNLLINMCESSGGTFFIYKNTYHCFKLVCFKNLYFTLKMYSSGVQTLVYKLKRSKNHCLTHKFIIFGGRPRKFPMDPPFLPTGSTPEMETQRLDCVPLLHSGQNYLGYFDIMLMSAHCV